MLGHFVDPFSNLLLQIIEVTTFERIFTGHHLEQHSPKRPHICLLVVEIAAENLRCHVKRGAAHGLVQLTFTLDCLC